MRQKYNTDASFLRYYFLYKPEEEGTDEPPIWAIILSTIHGLSSLKNMGPSSQKISYFFRL